MKEEAAVESGERELKPCPFCGSVRFEERYREHRHPNDPDEYWVGCMDCDARAYAPHPYRGAEAAREAWNRRTSSTNAAVSTPVHSYPVEGERERIDKVSRRLAEEAVQTLSDSEPSDRTIGGQELLEGTEFDGMFVVDSAELIRCIDNTISNAFFDRILALRSNGRNPNSPVAEEFGS